MYNGTEKDFNHAILPRKEYPDNQNRRPPNQNYSRQGRQHDRERTPLINVISRVIASGGDSHKERWSYLWDPTEKAVMNVESFPGNKRPRTKDVISFSEKDMESVKGPHDDAIVLQLKINSHWLERILVDTGSLTDILYLPAFKQIGYKLSDLGPVHTPLRRFTGYTL